MGSRRRRILRLIPMAAVGVVLALPVTVRGQEPTSGGQATAKADTAAAKLFEQTCSACHGKAGRGDGPAAVALNPKPADLGDPNFQAARSDVQLREVVTSAKGLMPPFGKQLTKEQIEGLVQYIRTLNRQE